MMTDLKKRDEETYADWDERVNGPARRTRRDAMKRNDWKPLYAPWRHGGSYVTTIVYPSGAVGCIASAKHTLSGKFEIACHPDAGTFRTRRAAAFAEREIALQEWRAYDVEV